MNASLRTGRNQNEVRPAEKLCIEKILGEGNENMAEPSYEELKSKLAELEKQVQGRKKNALDFRVSEKGGVSVYGLGRFPVTLYYEQWTRLLEQVDELREFLETNKSALKRKNPDS